MRNFLALTVLILSIALLDAQDVQFRAGDQVEVRFGGVPSDEVGLINGMYPVDGEGFINMPHVGKIKVSGLNQAQVQQTIENTYRTQQIYTAPTVTVSVPSGERLVNMGGDVRSPGRIPFTPDLTILSAINSAGGFTEYADQKKVNLLRGSERTVINVQEIRKDPSKDIKLRPGDSIEVPRSFW